MASRLEIPVAHLTKIAAWQASATADQRLQTVLKEQPTEELECDEAQTRQMSFLKAEFKRPSDNKR
jgi:hypothetical protein